MPAASNATATGLRRIVGPGATDPHTVAIEPSGFSSWTRPLTESATARIPEPSAPTPSGVLNWPLARPDAPNDRSSPPLRSKTSMRSLPVFVTYSEPPGSTAIARG